VFWRFGLGESRVVQAVPVSGSVLDSHYSLVLHDFNPSAVARDIGRVVRGPSTSEVCGQNVTTYLPYVEVANHRILSDDCHDIIMNEEKMLLLQ